MRGRVNRRMRLLLMGVNRSSAPVIPWYLTGNIPLANCIATYQPKGAVSQALSYKNIAHPGTHDAGVGVAPIWNVVTGWTGDGATTYLTTDIMPTDGTWSFICSYSGATAGTLFGSSQAQNLAIYPVQTGVWYRYGTSALVGANLASGVLGMAGIHDYRNGSSDGDRASSTADSVPFYLLARNASSKLFFAGNLLSFACYNITLSPAQMAAVSAAMAAL
jgi:hypothetical protein